MKNLKRILLVMIALIVLGGGSFVGLKLYNRYSEGTTWADLTDYYDLKSPELGGVMVDGIVLNKINVERVSIALQRFMVGAFEKVVIADRLRVAIDSVYSTPMAYSGFSLWLTVIGYSMQIYYDFSAY